MKNFWSGIGVATNLKIFSHKKQRTQLFPPIKIDGVLLTGRSLSVLADLLHRYMPTMTRSVVLAEYDHDPSQDDPSSHSNKPFRHYLVTSGEEAGVLSVMSQKRFGSANQPTWREWIQHYVLVMPKKVLMDLFLPVGYEKLL